MTPKAVEQLLTQDARLLARRDSPAIDQELEEQRQAALQLFFQWQDGCHSRADLEDSRRDRLGDQPDQGAAILILLFLLSEIVWFIEFKNSELPSQ